MLNFLRLGNVLPSIPNLFLTCERSVLIDCPTLWFVTQLNLIFIIDLNMQFTQIVLQNVNVAGKVF